jgi:type II secretory pathway component PulK
MSLKKKVGNQRGAALIVALLAMVLMMTIVVEFSYNTRVDLSMLSNHRLAQQGRYFAEVGVEAARVLLLSDLERDESAGAFIDYYAFEMADEEGGAQTGGGGLADMMGMAGGGMEEVWSMMHPEMPPLPLADTGGMIKLLIRDERSKVNLNTLDIPRGVEMDSPLAQRFINFFMACGLEEQDAAALIPRLVDWIDADDDASTQGAESDFYNRLSPPYVTRNAPLFSVAELRLIEGMTAENWARIAPHVTVHPRQGATLSKINVNTASVEVLQFLDVRIDDEVAQALVDERSRKPFNSMSEVQQVLSAYSVDGTLFNDILGKIDLRSDLFSVTSSALVHDIEYTAHAVLERRRGSQDVKTLYWRVD